MLNQRKLLNATKRKPVPAESWCRAIAELLVCPGGGRGSAHVCPGFRGAGCSTLGAEGGPSLSGRAPSANVTEPSTNTNNACHCMFSLAS